MHPTTIHPTSTMPPQYPPTATPRHGQLSTFVGPCQPSWSPSGSESCAPSPVRSSRSSASDIKQPCPQVHSSQSSWTCMADRTNAYSPRDRVKHSAPQSLPIPQFRRIPRIYLPSALAARLKKTEIVRDVASLRFRPSSPAQLPNAQSLPIGAARRRGSACPGCP